jgi:hypothetical protein
MKNSGYVFIKATLFIAMLIAGSILHAQEQRQILGTAGGKYGIVTVNKGLQKEDTVIVNLSVQWVDENLKPVTDNSSLIILDKNSLRISQYEYIESDLFKDKDFIYFNKSAELKFKANEQIKADALDISMDFSYLDKSRIGDYSKKEDFLLAQPKDLTVSYSVDRGLFPRKIIIPPSIEFISPIFAEGEKLKSEDSEMDVSIKVTDESGISSVTIDSAEAVEVADNIFRTRVALEPGDNTIVILAADNEGGIAQRKFIVNYEKKIIPPSIEFISPIFEEGEKLKSEDSEMDVSIKVTDEDGISSVTIDSAEAVAAADNIFRTRITLEPGDNTIVILAADNEGIITQKEFIVNYEKKIIPPSIEFISPIFEEGEQLKSEDSEMDVAVKVTAESEISSVTIDSAEATAVTNDIYRSRVALAPGDNTIVILAADNEGSITQKEFTVNYEMKIIAPPAITFISPILDAENKAYIKKGEIEVTVEVTDQSGINLVSINQRDAIQIKDNIYKSLVKLAPGDNIIYVMAVDNDGSISEEEVNVHCTDYSLAADMLLKGGKYYGLFIAIENYRDSKINDLENATEDAEGLYETLLTYYTFDEENMKILIDPTREDMVIELDKLAKKVTPKDNLLIFYAGHGYLDENSGIGYWLPADAKNSNTANWFRNSTVRDYISSINSNHTLLIADACFTGSIFKTRRAFATSAVAIEKLYGRPSRKAMTSGTLEEVPDKSVFVEYLIKRLRENTEIYLSSESLFTSFRTAVMNNSPNLPQYGEINNTGDEGGEFIFIRKRAPEGEE